MPSLPFSIVLNLGKPSPDYSQKLESSVFDKAPLNNCLGRLNFHAHLKYESREIWVIGQAYNFWSSDDLKQWAQDFDCNSVGQWASRLDGDWIAIVNDFIHKVAYIVSDRNGATRLFYSQEGDYIVISNSLMGAIPHVKEKRISSFGVFTSLTTYYPLDPYTVVDPIRVTEPGSLVMLRSSGKNIIKYYTPVTLDADYYNTENESIMELDAAFQRTFKKRICSGRTPLVLLSGGIDSVAMVRYLSEYSSCPIHTLTFSVKGQAFTEHAPARIAANHFATKHHELIIEPDSFVNLYSQALEESLNPNISTLLCLAIRNYLESTGVLFDVFTGEDSRLHTPTFDVPTRLGIFLNISDKGPRLPLLQGLAYHLLNLWPFYPTNYLKYIASRINPDVWGKLFFLHLNKFVTPNEIDMTRTDEYSQLLAEMPTLNSSLSIQDVFKKWAILSYRLQFSENMSEAVMGLSGPKTQVHVPFYDWDIIQISNRIPYRLASRGIFTYRSWSRFPMVNKRILRKVLEPGVPKSILYRRKATASALDVILTDEVHKTIRNILDPYLSDLLASVGKNIGDLIAYYVNSYYSGARDQKTVYAVFSICQMVALERLCRNSVTPEHLTC